VHVASIAVLHDNKKLGVVLRQERLPVPAQSKGQSKGCALQEGEPEAETAIRTRRQLVNEAAACVGLRPLQACDGGPDIGGANR